MEVEPAAPAPAAEPAEPEPTAEPTKTTPPDENLVGEAKRKQRAAEKEAKELRERLDSLEDRDKSETERERKARERAEQRATELDAKVQKLERGAWVRSAAAEAKFNDPDDAVAFADLSEIESEDDAERAVKSLAKRKPHLLKPSDPTPPAVGRVLENGQPTTPSKVDKAKEAEVEQAKEFAAKLKELSGDWQ